jgi:hypothetical protein
MAVPKTTQFTDATGKKVQLDALTLRLPPNSWQRRSCGIGSKGFRVYDWALIDSDHPDHQYLIRRSIDDGELAFYHCYNPHHAGAGELVHVAGARWPIEECFGFGKNEVGLDHYQVRTWDAWHRHPRPHRTHHQKKGRQHTEQLNKHPTPPDQPTEPETTPPIHRRLIALTLAEIRRLLPLIHHSEHTITHGLHWSTWRRRHQAQAQAQAHVRRHLRLQTLMI